jgi:peptidyl-prolyl cis-trans isomerase SurA
VIRTLSALGLVLAAVAPAAVGQDEPVLVDKVVAVVGNRPILRSQVDEEIFGRQSQGLKPPASADSLRALRQEIVQTLVDQELIVQQALRDTAVKVMDQEVSDAVDQQIRRVRQNFSTELDYREELKKAGFQTPEEYRRWLSDQQRRKLLQTALMTALRDRGKLKPVPPTEKEMRDFFENQRAQLGRRPATISFRQIVIAPRPDSSARARARARADSIAVSLRAGGDFAAAARRFSEDPGSKEQGGDLGWLRRGPPLAPEFEKAAFALKPGTISEPVETPFGYHVIQVQRLQPAEAQVRHILIMPEVTAANVDSARARAEAVVAALRGGATFDSLQRVNHDQAEEKEAANVAISQLPEVYQQALATVDSGSVSPVFVLQGGGGRSKFVVAWVTAKSAEGDVSYEDAHEMIRNLLSRRLAEKRYVQQLREAAYVEIREL